MHGIHNQYVKESYDANGILSDFSIQYPDDFSFSYDVVDKLAALEPDRPAMLWVNPEGEEHLFTFGEMKYYSDKCANALVAQGVEQGELVLVILRRHYQFWFTIIALDKIGAVVVPATFMLREHDLEYRVDSAEVKTIICTDAGEISTVVENVAKNSTTLKTMILVNAAGGGLTPPDEIAQLAELNATPISAAGELSDSTTAKGSVLSGAAGILATRIGADYAERGWLDFNALVSEANAEWERRALLANDPMIMYFSSGTTGNPKMVLHNSSYALGHLGTAKHWQNVKSDGGIHFTIADTGWGKAVWGKLYGQWLMEACVFTYDFDRFSGDEICALVEKYKISTLCMPPTMYRLIMQGHVNDYDLTSLEYSCTAGEALNPDLFDSWRERTGLYLTEGFGQTETPVTVANMPNMIPRPGSMGRPIPLYRTEILDGEGKPCTAGQTGEICIAYDFASPPPGLLLEYYRDGEKTAAAIYDGWYHTGDEAWKDEDGYYWYVGRNDDVIKSSGYRIGPFEIETVLLQHDAVIECAITGVPDPVRGTAVKATVVLAPGFVASDELTTELQQWVKTQTAPYKYPRIIDYVPELPKTVNGKIRRSAIREKDLT
jgi:acetyl-CoA synthetase